MRQPSRARDPAAARPVRADASDGDRERPVEPASAFPVSRFEEAPLGRLGIPAAESSPAGKTGAKPENENDGHRDRLRKRFLKAGAEGIADYELLELVLFRAIPRKDVKPIARALMKRFGSFAEALTASPELLRGVDGMGDAAITEFKIVAAAAQQLVKGAIGKGTVLGTWNALIDYCRAKMAFVEREEFWVLFLDKRNELKLDERMSTGTIDHTPVYAREVIKRALEVGATALVLVHNHPSGDTTPSQADVAMTRQLVALGKPMGIEVHDHLIVGRHGHTSLRRQRLI